MINKPTNLAELLRYLAANPVLEFHMPASNLIVRGNCGNVDMSKPAQVLPRRFLKKQGNALVFIKDNGDKSYLTYESAKSFSFFEDRFEIMGQCSPEPLKYFYKEAAVTV